jgi:hypothetical protein
MTIYGAAINLESVALNFIGGAIFLAGTVMHCQLVNKALLLQFTNTARRIVILFLGFFRNAAICSFCSRFQCNKKTEFGQKLFDYFVIIAVSLFLIIW